MCILRTVIFFLIFTLYQVNSEDICDNRIYLMPLNTIRVKNYSPKECLQLTFDGNEKLNAPIGLLDLHLTNQQAHNVLNITFSDVKWSKAFLKLSKLGHIQSTFCKSYTIENNELIEGIKASDECFSLANGNLSVPYEIEFRAQLNTDILYRKIIFTSPLPDDLDNSLALSKRAIFYSIDVSSNHELTLKLQPLPAIYNIQYYKVEVFKNKAGFDVLLDVRLLQPGVNTFQYITYNEEGYYYFKVSAINEECPEDSCKKTVSPKIYIRRKYPPLVIGIVGASFMIPFILFIFHMWTRRTQTQDEHDKAKDRLFIVYNQTPEKHYTIVKTLERTLKIIGNLQIVTKANEASHIIYICGTHMFEPDPSTHKLLVTESSKSISNVEIIVVSFPYSTKEIPSYLGKCLKFDLMDDFGKLIQFLNCTVEFEEIPIFKDLSAKVTAAQIQTEPKKITLNMPVIIITEQSDGSDTEAKEMDVLL
ncbi:hypothetical protein GWI33_022508 [Rhynchophorus ferrugineus]|uniref:Uncharacterized protein n=1 Tax=Rhynchophorus ferrugineus TaxID=354439 RepID=A0A834IQM1_RHYFE|nr:hypothetical protein GWI33_022508 [Rhynchophorus ferrugineus]